MRWPMPASVNCRAKASATVPLRTMTASRPAWQKLGAMEPSNPRPGTNRPSVFGPMSQLPAARASAAAASASCTGTYSAAAMMVGMRAAAHSAMASRTPSAGV